MSKVDYETKMNSKPYRFFDLIYRLLVVNVLTIILSCTVIFLFPSFVAATATLKEGNVEMNIFKQYFINFKKYLKKIIFYRLNYVNILSCIRLCDIFLCQSIFYR